MSYNRQEAIVKLKMDGWRYAGDCRCTVRASLYKKGNFTIKMFPNTGTAKLIERNKTMSGHVVFEKIEQLIRIAEQATIPS